MRPHNRGSRANPAAPLWCKQAGCSDQLRKGEIRELDSISAQMRPSQKAAGMVLLSLFGSAARNEATPQSDVDLIAESDNGRECLAG